MTAERCIECVLTALSNQGRESIITQSFINIGILRLGFCIRQDLIVDCNCQSFNSSQLKHQRAMF